MKPSKILHTEWSTGWGGQEIRIIQDSLEFMKRGYPVMILCQPGSRIYSAAIEKKIPVIPLTLRSGLDPWAIGRCLIILKSNAIDLVHTHSSVDSWCCSIAAKMLGIPVIRSRHISAPISTNFLSFFLYMKLANQVITSGEIIKERMITLNGYDPEKIVSIPTGLPEAWFSFNGEEEGLRREFNIDRHDFLLGIVAMLRSWKGHGYLLEAVKSLQEKIPRLKLLIIGDGPQEKAIRDAIVRHGLEHRIIMTGYRGDIPQILKSLDLFVLPSYADEGVPQGILQAMALGIPVISTSAGGIGEAVTHGETGTLVPPRDIQALSQAIDWVFRNREASLKMAHKARESVMTHFALKGLTDKTENIYQEVLEKEGHKIREFLPFRSPHTAPPLYPLSGSSKLEYFLKIKHLLANRWASKAFDHSNSFSKIKSGKP